LIYLLLVIAPSWNFGVAHAASRCPGENKKNKELLCEVKSENKEIKELLLEVKSDLGKLLAICKPADKVYKNCAEAYKDGHQSSGVYKINPDNAGAFEVYCDQKTAGGGWTVFQKRLDGSVDFYLGWDDYKRGFGNLSDEFWLGLDKIHRLTKEQSKLRVDLEDFSGSTAYAEYSSFGVGDEGSKYKLSLGGYSGTAGDSLSYHNGMEFTTKDQDHDPYSADNCASMYKGAWWYKTCHEANLNGLYHKGGNHASYADGVNWYKWKDYHYSAKRAEMKIKPVA